MKRNEQTSIENTTILPTANCEHKMLTSKLMDHAILNDASDYVQGLN